MSARRIKVAMITNHFEITGIGTVIMNYCKALDKDKYSLTILAGSPISDKYVKECALYGVNLIKLPSRHKNPLMHYIELWKALKKGKFDIVHDHGSSSMMAIELTVAKAAKANKLIAHSHNSTCPNKKIHNILNPYFKTLYSKAIACGELAGNWLFGECNFEILPNGFHTDEFVFSKDNRTCIRNKLKIGNRLVIGHIGRINEQKNQEYLLKVFDRIAAVKNDAILLIVGTGPDEDKIRGLIKMSQYRDRIILYGETNSPTALYSAMDIFVFPSLFEGLPVVLLEAQISGLPCIVSDRITKEVDLGDIYWCSIDDKPERWADSILDIPLRTDQERKAIKEKNHLKIKDYDIDQSVKQLDKIYSDLLI